MKLEIDYKKLKTGLKKKTINPAEITDLMLYEFHSVDDLTFLDGMVNLRRFDAGMRWGSDLDFSRITACKNLEELDFNNDNTTDLSWLGELPKLKVLQITGDKLDYSTLPPLPTLEAVYFGGEHNREALPDYNLLKQYPNLRRLGIRTKKLKDLGFLRHVPKLESLSVSDDSEPKHMLSDISHLACCPNLVELELSYCEAVNDMTAIGSLGKLKKLRLYHLGWDKRKASIAPLGKLTELEHLYLKHVGGETGFEHLAPLTKLKHFELASFWGMKLPSIAFLNGMVNLRYLSLPGLPSVDSVEPLRNLTELEHITFLEINQSITNFSFLNGLTKLKTLLWYSCSRGKYLQELKSPVLTKLVISGVKFADNLLCISHLTSLEELEAGSNIKSIQGIEALTRLKKAEFRESTKLVSLDGIEKCSALEELNITGCNKLNDLSPLKKLKSLKSLTMYKTRVNLNTLPKRRGLEISS